MHLLYRSAHAKDLLTSVVVTVIIIWNFGKTLLFVVTNNRSNL